MNKFDAYIIRFLGAFVPIVTYVMFTSLIGMTRDITRLKECKSEKINNLTASKYVSIERVRSSVAAELFVDFGKMIKVKEEELEPFRLIAIRKLNRSISTGTTRGGR